MPRGWRIGRIGGVEIRMDPSVLIIAGLLTYDLWTAFSDRFRFPGTSKATALFFSVLAAVLFFASILAHELAHAGMSKLRHIPVAGITLWMLGGATHARIESRGPADEFLVTVVGPGTSLALGGVFLGLREAALAGGAHVLPSMFGYLGVVNVFLAGFNLVPGFPLDGGRLLRSALWRWTGSLARATRIAARVGQVFAVLLIGLGVVGFVRRQDAFALWPALIGMFLYRGATSAAAEGDRRKLLEDATVADVMAPPPPTVPADLTVEEALHRYLVGHEREAFPVVEGDRVVGFVSLGTIRGVPLDRRVREAMVGTAGTLEASPAERLDRIVDRLGASPTGTVLVVDNGALVGVIEPEDVARFVRSGNRRTVADGSAPPPRPDRWGGDGPSATPD